MVSESRGISVWVDVTGLKAGVDFLSKIGQAIIDAKVRRAFKLFNSDSSYMSCAIYLNITTHYMHMII